MSPFDAYEGSIEITAALSVTDADALSDSRWSIAPPCGDRDREIAVLSFRAAFPDRPPERAQKVARKAPKRGGQRPLR